MRAILITVSLIGLALANASASISVSVDESGDGFWFGDQSGTNHGVLAGSYRVLLPGGGTQFTPALTYTFPWTFSVTGDLLMTEEGGGSQISDVIRFTTANQLVFFSDFETGTGGQEELGDKGLPYQLVPSSATGQLVYAGPEGGGVPDGGLVIYTPTSTQPGYVTGQSVTYYFVSEVPEPSTMTIAGAALLLPFALRILRKNRKA